MKQIKFTVTEDQIKEGVPSSSESCPVALALKNKLPEFSRISVRPHCVYFYTPGERYYTAIGILSDRVIDFITDFDTGVPVIPEEFEILIHDVKRKI